MSRGGPDVRGTDSWELDYRVRGRIAPKRGDVCYTVRVGFVVGIHCESLTGHTRATTEDERTRDKFGKD